MADRTTKGADERLMFRFGFIADVQYADIPDALNFEKTMTRYYRGTLDSLKEADQWWQQECLESGGNLSFIANLGDVLDGQNMNKDGDTARAISLLCSVFAHAEYAPFTVHLVGNHELYNFTREQLCEGVQIAGEEYKFCAAVPPEADAAEPVCDEPRALYYAFYPPGSKKTYRVVVLDPYDVSCMRDGGGRHGIELYEGHGMDKAGLELLRQHNPNPVGEQKQTDFFEGLVGEQGRWVPFNGGLGETQMRWLRAQLEAAQAEGQRVILLSHVILHPDATPDRSCRTLLWNYEEVLALLGAFPGVVPLVLCGHAHTGATAFDAKSRTHHRTCSSPLEFPGSYGCCAVMRDGEIRIEGRGSEPTWVIAAPTAEEEREQQEGTEEEEEER